MDEHLMSSEGTVEIKASGGVGVGGNPVLYPLAARLLCGPHHPRRHRACLPSIRCCLLFQPQYTKHLV